MLRINCLICFPAYVVNSFIHFSISLLVTFSYLQSGGKTLQDMVCTLGNRRKFEEVQRCLDVIGFSHEVTKTMLSVTMLRHTMILTVQ